MRVRASKKKQLVQKQHKTLREKRSAESKTRKEKRKVKGKAEEVAKAILRSPAGKKAAETLKEKRKVARKKEQVHYQETAARTLTRLGGKSSRLQTELHNELEVENRRYIMTGFGRKVAHSML
jgi:hypothetical protein